MKVLVLGYFGYKTNQLDGQTVKTREIYRLLATRFNNIPVDYFDTQQFKYSKFSFFTLLKKLLACKTLVYLPASKNLQYIFPIIFIISKLWGMQIIYPIVGGWLAEWLDNKPLHVFMLKHISVLLSEIPTLCEQLKERYNINNTDILTNFRPKPKYKEIPPHKEFRIVFMARVCEEKGIYSILQFAKYFNDNKIETDRPLTITFYGGIAEKDKTKFLSSIKEFKNVKYGGIIDREQIIPTLQDFDLMLLPSFYKGEGLPGSIVEAYFAGIPVIVSNWKFLPEFVEHGKTGFVFNLNCEQELYKKPELLTEMKKNSHLKSLAYTEENAITILNKYIQNPR